MLVGVAMEEQASLSPGMQGGTKKAANTLIELVWLASSAGGTDGDTLVLLGRLCWKVSDTA